MADHAVSRRDFLRTGTAAAAAAAVAPTLGREGEAETPRTLATRVLGRTGVPVTIIGQGTAMGPDDRMLNTYYECGGRYLDTADCYKGGHSEKGIGEWLAKTGRRKEMYIVTKDHPQSPEEWEKMVDRRLETLQTDTIDLYFIHQLGDREYPREGDEWPLRQEWVAAVERMKKSGKIKGAGFSTHVQPIQRRIDILNNAAQSPWVDALMVATSPILVHQNAAFNKALDACHKAGVGLISMKEMRYGLGKIGDLVPKFEQKGLTAPAAVLSAMWTDERFATICSHMANIKQIRENTASAANFKPLSKDDMATVHRMLDAVAKGYCVGCDGSCKLAAGTNAELSDIARYLAYFEQDGDRDQARRLFRALPAEARDWSGADLQAASNACVSKLDFASIMQRAAEKLA